MKYQATLHRRIEVDEVPYVYATGSAAILRLDDVSDGILGRYAVEGGADGDAWRGVGGPDEAVESRQTFEQMLALGLIRPVGESVPPPPTLPPMPYPLATLVLNVTNRCNLSCTYCYEYGEDRIADSTRSDGTPKSPMMSPETARQSVDFLFDGAGSRGDVTITFFGGETLLNFDTIREAARYATARGRQSGRGVGLSLTTNATLLTDEVVDFLVEYRFGINISMDGAEKDHDRHRTFKSGRGSYEKIVPNIKKLLERNRPHGRPIGARVTLTAGSTDIPGIFEHLTEEIGFDEVGFAPVTSAPGNDHALSDDNYWDILDGFRSLAKSFIDAALEGRRHGFSNLNDIVRELHQGINKAHPCGAGLGLLGVSTEGELGLCHRFVESGQHEVGNVATGLDASKRAEFLTAGHISTKVACHSCFARPLCSGGCYHEAYVRYGDASQPNLHYCDWIRAWTDLGLETYGRIMNGNSNFLERFEPPVIRERTESTP